MTLAEAYRIQRNAARNVGRGKGYRARNLDAALAVLEPFWAEHGSVYVTPNMIASWDNDRNTASS